MIPCRSVCPLCLDDQGRDNSLRLCGRCWTAYQAGMTRSSLTLDAVSLAVSLDAALKAQLALLEALAFYSTPATSMGQGYTHLISPDNGAVARTAIKKWGTPGETPALASR